MPPSTPAEPKATRAPPPPPADDPELQDGEPSKPSAAPEDAADLLAAQLEDLLAETEPPPNPEIDNQPESGIKDAEALVGEVLGGEGYVGDESLCPACGAATSVYAPRCQACGAIFDTENCRCAHCGEMVPSEALFCPKCTQPLTNPEALCPSCSSPVPFNATSCPYCMVELEVGEMRCSHCGSGVEANAVSCVSCGSLLVEGAKTRTEAIAISGNLNTTVSGVQVGELHATLDGAGGVSEVQVENKIENRLTVEAVLRQPEGMLSPAQVVEHAQVAQREALQQNQEEVKQKRDDTRKKLAAGRTKRASALFPFSAVLGQEKMKLALMVNVVDPLVGGVLISGQKGTAKSVTVRGLTEITPDLKMIDGCRFSCDPAKPQEWCWECADKYKGRTLEGIPTKTRPLRVVDLPLNATEDRVVGTLDVSKMLTEGEVAFDHGVLADSNRGILYVDEINLLDDYVVDVLLDSAAMGSVTVEREGISVRYPARFVMVGTMNPEEGSLRPQLLDRIALQVTITGIEDVNTRMEIVRRRQDFERDPADFRARFEPLQQQIRDKITRSRELLPHVEVPPKLFAAIPKVTTAFGVDGHRADIMIERGSRALAALEGRTQVSSDDVGRIAEMALPHRMRRKPFEQTEFSPERLRRVIEENL